MEHPLDRPIWNALTSRQREFAEGAGDILRFGPAFAPFAATAAGTAESFSKLADLVPLDGQIVLQQAHQIPAPSGLVLRQAVLTVQMVADQIERRPTTFKYEMLTPADAPEMLALARLTKPGPFAERTNELGRFLGVRRDGQLVAMAGERMKPGPFTEISGVCTHPDHRGQGYAAGLMREVALTILERGETPFLHAFADNVGAIALYEKLGFVTRWRPMLWCLDIHRVNQAEIAKSLGHASRLNVFKQCCPTRR